MFQTNLSSRTLQEERGDTDQTNHREVEHVVELQVVLNRDTRIRTDDHIIQMAQGYHCCTVLFIVLVKIHMSFLLLHCVRSLESMVTNYQNPESNDRRIGYVLNINTH